MLVGRLHGLLFASLLISTSCSDRPREVDQQDGRIPTVPLTAPGGAGAASKTRSPSSASTTTPREPLQPTASGDNFGLMRQERAKRCVQTQSAGKIPLLTLQAIAEVSTKPDLRYLKIKEGLKSSCDQCHLAPGAQFGNFSYIGDLRGDTLSVGGKNQSFPGIADAAMQMRDSIVSGKMPPESIRKLNPAAADDLGKTFDAWIAAGMPVETKVELPRFNSTLGLTEAPLFTDIGDCVPNHAATGVDAVKDDWFAVAANLPPDIKDTDFVSFDADVLAKSGTFSYNIEYPLWTDNAGKSRLIHLPVDANGNVQSITYDAAKHSFEIPNNTRFYKSFYRAVKLADGKTVQYRPIETRLIVVRHAPQQPLYGTYVWDDAGVKASLLTTPYRDGTPWKDAVMEVTVDETTKATRRYAVPARHRCEQCHMGGEDGSFVLGFTPLQINRRAYGEAGRDQPVLADELTQVQRFRDYKVIAGVDEHHPLPKLEDYAGDQAVSVHALRAQGYVLGNCSHCHNPNGFAIKKNNVTLDLSAGKLFSFDTNTHSKDYVNQKFVSHEGDLATSFLYFRASASKSDLGLLSAMPMHSPGGPDCRGVKLLGKWVLTYNKDLTEEQIDAFEPPAGKCTPNNALNSGDFDWTEEDFTGSQANGPFVPRREDWNDPNLGMPELYRQLTLDQGLAALTRKKIPVDFWQAKPECKFPAGSPPDGLKPWMLKPDHTPKRPLGELYYATPGAFYFTTTCSKCHGPHADGSGAIGQALVTWSGGKVKVADFLHGMFGADGENLRTFDSIESGQKVNLAGNYLIWMAMEGTKINVPPQASAYLGNHKAQMLKQIKDRCERQIPSSSKASSARFPDHDIFREICLYDNLPVTAPDIQFDPNTDKPINPEAHEAWLNKGAFNAGWAIYEYLREATKTGQWQPSQSECETVYKE